MIDIEKCRKCKKWHQCLHETCDGFGEAEEGKQKSTMKITVELKDEDVEWLTKTFNIDITKLINSIITNLIEGLKEFKLADSAKIPMTSEDIRKFADEIGRKAWRGAMEDETP